MGENTVAAIITRGLAEIMRLGIALGAKPATLAGLAGVGDLVATCTSPHSRNRSFGTRLGRGDDGGGEAGRRRARRRRRHVVRVGAGARGQLRRRDAVDRRGAPGVPQRVLGATRRSRCCSVAAPSRSSRMAGLYGDSTRSVKALGSKRIPGGPIAPPPVLASAYHISADEDDSLDSYGRGSNPTWRQLESALAELEGAASALTFGSGMAAITSVLRVLVKPRSTARRARRRLLPGAPLCNGIPCAAGSYGRSRRTCADIMRRCSRTPTWCWPKHPSNPGLDVVDLHRLAMSCREPRRHPGRRQHHRDTAGPATAVARR